MRYFEIAGVAARPRLRFPRHDGGTYTVYSGVISLVASRAFRGAIRPDDRQAISFFVPDSPAFTTDPAIVGLELSLKTIRTMGNPNLVTFGAHDEQASVDPDPRGGEHRWLQISFQVPVSSVAAADLNYRLTTT
ncbi:hypothetical protein [Phytohabitans suffuscus]|uniref:Uncharacterized protein n=1 Tax=Phytohabitans suffuscus TaxID=624315 RepID=A0A6F8Y9W6_9ACTN|nr:hypothetical protein [Phytohabitans suffuscus]BCB82924.1 hypothetical protein Psuf_002370 [Phytohabitans suffuscus]